MSRSVSALFGARPRIALNTTEPTQPLETKNINETANETASDKKTGVQSQMFFAPSGSKRFVPDEIHDDFYSDDFHSDDDLHGDDDNEQSPVFGS